MNPDSETIRAKDRAYLSKKSFASCPICAADSIQYPDQVSARYNENKGRTPTRWTRCEVCGHMSRQRYNKFLHVFLEPDVVWEI